VGVEIACIWHSTISVILPRKTWSFYRGMYCLNTIDHMHIYTVA